MKSCFAALFIVLVPFSVHALEVPDFAAADLVLGQSDFTSAGLPVPPTAASLEQPSAVVVDRATGKVFVADTGNNRVLRYRNAAALSSGAAAELVFGQADFDENAAPDPPNASSMDSPTGLWMDGGGRLWVADADNHRILMFPGAAATATNGPAANLVLGQPDAFANAPDTTRSILSSPMGLFVDPAGRLWVADFGNNRVLRFDNAANKTTGANADGVLGQGQDPVLKWTGSTARQDQNGFDNPLSVSVDATGTLWVADRNNNRVLGFPSAATVSDGTNAARIIGQPDFNTVAPGTSSIRLSGPSAIFADAANGLWVLDQSNNRALRFAGLSSLNIDEPASSVIGQPGFTSSDGGRSSRRIDAPFLGMFVQPDGTLWLSDLDNHRTLRFAAIDGTPPTVRIKGKRKVKTAKKRIVLRGTASDDTGVARVVLSLGKKQILAGGTTAWRKAVRLQKTRTVVRAMAFDTSGLVSAPAKAVITRTAQPLR